MPVVIGNIPVCSSPVSLFCEIQAVGRFPIWKRYDALLASVGKYLPEKYQSFLAKPVGIMEPDGELIEWFTPEPQYTQPKRLSSLNEDEKIKYNAILQETLSAYNSAIQKCTTNGDNVSAEYLKKALMYVGDYPDYLYCYDDAIFVV